MPKGWAWESALRGPTPAPFRPPFSSSGKEPMTMSQEEGEFERGRTNDGPENLGLAVQVPGRSTCTCTGTEPSPPIPSLTPQKNQEHRLLLAIVAGGDLVGGIKPRRFRRSTCGQPHLRSRLNSPNQLGEGELLFGLQHVDHKLTRPSQPTQVTVGLRSFFKTLLRLTSHASQSPPPRSL